MPVQWKHGLSALIDLRLLGGCECVGLCGTWERKWRALWMFSYQVRRASDLTSTDKDERMQTERWQVEYGYFVIIVTSTDGEIQAWQRPESRYIIVKEMLSRGVQ